MAGEKQKRVAVADASVATMASRFGRYKPEEEKTVRKAEVVEDETLKKMKDAWKAANAAVERNLFSDFYDAAIMFVHGMEYGVRDVEKFSLAMVEFEHEERFYQKAGVFLGALINEGKDEDYIIHSSHLACGIDHLGYRNTKNITVQGSAGDYCGNGMEGGSITVEGDTGGGCGYDMEGGSVIVKGNTDDTCGYQMKGGSITVNGDAGERCGHEMEGGSVIVNGDAGHACGSLMKGGEIHINGEISTIRGDTKLGKIFHQGELIFPQPTRLERVWDAIKRAFS
jgi:hypothetical protein